MPKFAHLTWNNNHSLTPVWTKKYFDSSCKIIFYFEFSSILQIPGESTLKRNFQLLQREGHQAKPSAPPQQSHNQQHRGQKPPQQQGHQRDNHREHGGHRPPSSHQGWPVSSHFQAQPVQPQQHNKVPRQSQIIGKTSTFTTYSDIHVL